MSAHVEWHDPTAAAVRIALPRQTWDGYVPGDGDWDEDLAIDEGHYGLVVDCLENVAVFEGTVEQLAAFIDLITTTWEAFKANHGVEGTAR